MLYFIRLAGRSHYKVQDVPTLSRYKHFVVSKAWTTVNFQWTASLYGTYWIGIWVNCNSMSIKGQHDLKSLVPLTLDDGNFGGSKKISAVANIPMH